MATSGLGSFLGGLGGGAIGSAVVRLYLDASQYEAGLVQAKAGVTTNTAAMGASFEKFKGAASLAYAAAGLAAVKFVKDSIGSASEHQQVIAKLTAQVGQNTKAYEDQATALQNLTGYQDELILSADTVLSRFKLTGDEVRQAIPIVLDYARATGQDVPTAAGNIGRALLGNTRALKAVGIQFTATGNTAKDFDTILGLLQSKIGGQASAYAQTFAGRMEILAARFDDVKEAVGTGLLPLLEGIADAFSSITPILEKTAPLLVKLGIAFGVYKLIQFTETALVALRLAVFGNAEALGVETAALAINTTAQEANATAAGQAAAARAAGAGGAAAGAGGAAAAGGGAAAAGGGLFGLGGLAFLGIGAVSGQRQVPPEWVPKATEDQKKMALSLMETGRQIAVVNGLLPANSAAVDKNASAYRGHAGDTAKATQNLREYRDALLSLSGGVLGVVTNMKTLRSDQAELNRLQNQGKEGTKAYRDQQLQVLQSQLALTQSLREQAQQMNQNGVSTADIRKKLVDLGTQAELSKSAVRRLVDDALGPLGDRLGWAKRQADALDAALSRLNARSINIDVTTHYRKTGATPNFAPT